MGFNVHDRWLICISEVIVIHEYSEIIPRASGTLRGIFVDLLIPHSSSESVRTEHRPHCGDSSYPDLGVLIAVVDAE